jgi:transmembrane 9 superfamily member 2/4
MFVISKKRLIDGLPGATKRYFQDSTGKELIMYEDGFSLGSEGSKIDGGQKGEFYINNHVQITMLYHYEQDSDKNPLRIVGFEIVPISVNHDLNFEEGSVPKTCPVVDPKPLILKKQDTTIAWSYSVNWELSSVKWALRWDVYLKMKDTQIHWFSIINSLMIVLFLSGMVAMIIMRTVKFFIHLAFNAIKKFFPIFTLFFSIGSC